MESEEVHPEHEHHPKNSGIYNYFPPLIGLFAGILIAGGISIIKGISVIGGLLLIAVFLALMVTFIYHEIRRWPQVSAKSWQTIQRGGVTGDPQVIGSVGFPVAIFLFTEVMLFAAAFAAYFSLRATYPVWPPPGAPELDTLIPTMQTGFLIASSIMIEYALASVRRGNQTGLKIGAIGCTVLGSLFLIVQFGIEWPHLILEGILLPSMGLYGASFFLLTSFHGGHVFGGVVVLTITTIRSFMGHFTERSHGLLEATGTYWHFVHIVWLFLFALIWQGGFIFQ